MRSPAHFEAVVRPARSGHRVVLSAVSGAALLLAVVACVSLYHTTGDRVLGLAEAGAKAAAPSSPPSGPAAAPAVAAAGRPDAKTKAKARAELGGPPTANKGTGDLMELPDAGKIAQGIVDYANEAREAAAAKAPWHNKGAAPDNNAYDHSDDKDYMDADEPGRYMVDGKNIVSTFGRHTGPFVNTEADAGAEKGEGFAISTQADDWFHDTDSVKCPPGQFGPFEDCKDCPEGFFCKGEKTKEECPPGSTSAVGASSLSECKCKGGYYGADGERCSRCEEGSYCPGGSEMTACPEGALSPAGSDEATDCTCLPGTFGSPGSICTSCPADSYCPDGQHKKACPSGSSSDKRSQNVFDCKCSKGTYPKGSSRKCEMCDPNFYCPGSNAKRSCPVGYESPPESDEKSDCQKSCVAGEFGSPGACKSCPAGKFCVGGEAPARSCPPRSDSPAGSKSESDCECVPGSYDTGGKCDVCPEGSFCPGGGAVRGCKEGFVAPAGASSEAQCKAGSVQAMRDAGLEPPSCPHRDHDDRDAVILYQHCGQKVPEGEAQSYRHGGKEYATLHFKNPALASEGCQKEFASIPDGWEIAPDDAASLSAIKARNWATKALVLKNGAAYHTKTGSRKSCKGGSCLAKRGSKYKPSECSARILITEAVPDGGPGSVVYKGSAYKMIDGTKPDDRLVHCQRHYKPLPKGWSIARNNADSIAVISMHGWGTHVVFVSDGTSYHVGGGLYNPPGNKFRLHRSILKSGNSYKPPFCHARILIIKDGLNRGADEVGQAPSLFSGVAQALASVTGGPGQPTVTDGSAPHGRKLLAAAASEGTASGGVEGVTTMLAMGRPDGWVSQLGAGRYASVGVDSCDNDEKVCVQRNCGVVGADMSSMDIPEGMTVTLYDQQGFKGNKKVFKGPMDANAHCLTESHFNDKARSIVITGP